MNQLQNDTEALHRNKTSTPKKRKRSLKTTQKKNKRICKSKEDENYRVSED